MSNSVQQYLSLDSVREMGWWNLMWVALIASLVLGARAKKVGVTSIGKNEWGMLEIFGFPLVPVPFGMWPFIKGIFHVKEVSTAPTRVELSIRSEVGGRVRLVVVTVFVVVAERPASGSLIQRFIELRRNLIAALYNALDEDVSDAENPERISQTKDILEAGVRSILVRAETCNEVTLASLIAECGETLKSHLGESIVRVLLREDAPVDGQLWKEGRRSDGSDELEMQLEATSDDPPPANVTSIAAHSQLG